MTDLERVEEVMRQHVIDWNKKQFYRAINQERFDDAKRYKENIEYLEGQSGA